MTTDELKRVLDTVFRFGKGRCLLEDEDLAVLLQHVFEQMQEQCNDPQPPADRVFTRSFAKAFARRRNRANS